MTGSGGGWRVWADGVLVDPGAPLVSATDQGLTLGLGCFETVATRFGAPIALDRHLARLSRTAGVLGLSCPSDDRLRSGTEAAIGDHPPTAGRLRITLTAGQPGPGGGHVIAAHGPQLERPAESRAVIAPFPINERSPLAGLKTLSYAANVIAARWAADRQADEALVENTAGELCEGTGSNLFLVIDGEVLTPPLSSGCLAGVTREMVLESSPVTERALRRSDLDRADEVFLTSTTRRVQPVITVEDHRFEPGPVTQVVSERLERLLAEG